MSDPLKPDPTALGQTGKIFIGGSVATMKARDLSNPDEVYDLAEELLKANDRELMRVTLPELRALARFAVAAGVIASHAAELVTLSDANAPKPQLAAKLGQLCDVVRTTPAMSS